MFSQKEVDPGLEEAFTGAIDILRLLSRQSAQAAHYSEILTMLSNAITEQRQRLTFQRRQSSQYVSKLFSLNDSPPHRHENPKPENTIKADGVLSPVSTHANNIYQLTQGDGSMTPDVDALFSGWEGLDLPLWDSFPFLTEPVRLQDRSDGSQGL